MAKLFNLLMLFSLMPAAFNAMEFLTQEANNTLSNMKTGDSLKLGDRAYVLDRNCESITRASKINGYTENVKRITAWQPGWFYHNKCQFTFGKIMNEQNVEGGDVYDPQFSSPLSALSKLSIFCALCAVAYSYFSQE